MSLVLLIDRKRYIIWKPKSEEEFSRLVKEHINEIFGANSLYFDIDPKLRSKAGIGTKPDGFIIILTEEPYWYVVEFELKDHPVDEHIMLQLGKFRRALKSTDARLAIVDAMYEDILSDEMKRKVLESRGIKDIYRFLSDLILHREPEVVIIIDEKTAKLKEAIEELKPTPTIVEFKTFMNEEKGLEEHVHLFTEIVKKPPLPDWRGFWAKLLNRLYVLMPEIPRQPPAKTRYQWLDTGIDWPISHVHFEWWVHRLKDGWIGIELHFEKPCDAEFNRKALKWFMKLRGALERELGETIHFEEEWGKCWAKLYIKKEFKGHIFHVSDEFKKWIVEMTAKFFNVFRPRLEEYRKLIACSR